MLTVKKRFFVVIFRTPNSINGRLEWARIWSGTFGFKKKFPLSQSGIEIQIVECQSYTLLSAPEWVHKVTRKKTALKRNSTYPRITASNFCCQNSRNSITKHYQLSFTSEHMHHRVFQCSTKVIAWWQLHSLQSRPTLNMWMTNHWSNQIFERKINNEIYFTF